VKRDVFLSHEEVEGMLGITLQETRIYREFKEEGRREREAEMLPVIVPALLKAGMTIEQIAEQLKVEIEVIRQTAQENG
jgi:predicted transposase YdaD